MARALFTCDVRRMPADALTVDILARLHVAARRRGWELRIEHASPELHELVDFMGLGGVVVVEGQPEKGEEPFRIEKEGEADDLPVDDFEHLE